MKKTYSGWLLVGHGMTIAYDRSDRQCLRQMTKRGIPQGSLTFNTEKEALSELHTMKCCSYWPLWIDTVKVEECYWR